MSGLEVVKYYLHTFRAIVHFWVTDRERSSIIDSVNKLSMTGGEGLSMTLPAVDNARPRAMIERLWQNQTSTKNS